MTKAWRVLSVVTIMLMSIVALPAKAGGGGGDDDDGSSKKFSVNLSPASVTAGSPASMTAVFKNETQSGGDNNGGPIGNGGGGQSGGGTINSVKLSAPAGLTITAVANPPSGTATIANGGGSVSVSNMYPVKPGKTFTLSITVSPAASCTSSNVNWNATAWTGSSFNGSTFKLLTDSHSSLQTSVVGSCALSFSVQPQNAVTGQTIGGPVTVNATPASLFSGTQITLGIASSPGGSPTLAAGTAVVDGSGKATFPSLALTGNPGQYTLSASSTVAGSTATTSAPFTLWGGSISCGGVQGQLDPSDPVTYVLGTDPGKFGLTRGPNKDAGGCNQVPYTFTLTTSTTTTQTASFIIPSGTGQKVAAEYVVVFAAVPVDSAGAATGWTSVRPNVSWGITSPQLGTTDYVPALACVRDPADFAQVNASDLPGLLPIIPSVAPFTTNPNPQYQPDGTKTAKICVAQQGWTAVGTDTSGRTLLQFWFKLIDESDGFLSFD